MSFLTKLNDLATFSSKFLSISISPKTNHWYNYLNLSKITTPKLPHQNLFKLYNYTKAMAFTQERSKRKPTGGRFKKLVKKLAQLGDKPSMTKIDKPRLKAKRIRGGKQKLSLLSTNKINVIDQKSKKSQITEIISILENPANRHYVRRGIITKGTVVKTKIGKVKVTSRPGQEGATNGILMWFLSRNSVIF